MTHQETKNDDESIKGNQPVDSDGLADIEYPVLADTPPDLLSRRGTLGLLSLGGLGLLSGQVSAQQGQRGQVWKTDIDADGYVGC